MTQLTQLDKAIIIATKAHSGINDKGGKPYIFHPMRVAMNVYKVRKYPIFKDITDEVVYKVICACILHDTVEDTKDQPNPVTFDMLRAEGIEEDIVRGVDGFTRREGETYSEFIERTMLDIISRMGKACDLLDNMDISRLEHCSIEVRKNAKKRIEKRYKPSLARILGEDNQTLIDLLVAKNSINQDPILSVEEIQSYIKQDKNGSHDLTSQQIGAIQMALQSNVSLIAGHAGTGVTFTLKTIIECLEKYKPGANIHIFSGSAKSRLNLLYRLSKRIKNVHQSGNEELMGDLLVIHEPQIINRPALIRLLGLASNIRILFVGDLLQIPMDNGVNLNEIVEKSGINCTILTERFRQ